MLSTLVRSPIFVLREIRGRFDAALMSPASGTFGIAAGPQSVLAFLFSPLVLMVLAIAFVVAWALSAGGGFHTAYAPYAVMAVGSLATQLKEAEDNIAAKSDELHKIFEASGPDIDFTKADVLRISGKADPKSVIEHITALNTELDDLAKKRNEVVRLKKIHDDNEQRRNTPVNPLAQPDGNSGGNPKQRVQKDLGALVVGSAAIKNRKANPVGSSIEEGFTLDDLKSYEPGGTKATFLTTAGWPPESLRIPGLVIPKATRPIQLLDLIPTGATGMAVVKYMEETTLTHASAERAENASYPESAFALTEQSSTVRLIGASVPVSDEQLEDVDFAQSYLEGRLTFGNRQRLDSECLIGDGIAPNLTGIKNKSGINTQAKSTDSIPDAVYKAARVARVTGRSNPNAVVFHPTDWEKVRLLTDANGNYIWGSPALPGPQTIWGLIVALCDADSAGSAYVGDYAGYCQLFERRGMEVAVGYVSNDFLQGRRTIRAGFRVAFVIFRAAAFTQVTGL